MALAIFTKAGNAESPLTLPKGRFLPNSDPYTPNQLRGIAGGGQVKIADLGDAEHMWECRFLRISKTDRTAIIDFLQDTTVNYAENTFTFTDEDAVAHTVRWWDKKVDYPHIKGNLYNVIITLREEIT